MKIQVEKILEYLHENRIEHEYIGDRFLEIEKFCSLKQPQNKSIFWVKKIENFQIEQMMRYKGMLAVIHTQEKLQNINYINCKNPKMVFFSILDRFFQKEQKCGIEPTSIVETADIGSDTYIGHHCYINKNVKIGSHVKIMHHVAIICPTVIGDHVQIHSGVIIGSDGFGYFQDEKGDYKKVVHYGGVKIADGVEIGANTCIDRGTIDDTVIGNNTKIDSLCLVGHNVQIGRNVLVIGNTALGGSSVIEDNAYIAPMSAVMNQVRIGVGAYTGIGSVVLKDVEDGQQVFGNPARIIRKADEGR